MGKLDAVYAGLKEFTETILSEIADYGINDILNSKHLKEVYNKIKKKYGE